MARQPKLDDTPAFRPKITLEALNRLIKMCEETAAYCDRCTAGSLDVQPEREKNAEQLRVARDLKRAFFPNAP